MTRLTRLALLLVLAALVAPAAASAAPRMWMGFQDDPYFRWLPERFFMRDRAVHANATIMKTTVYWFNTAPRRPANATNPFDPAYRWEDLDEFVRQAADRDIEVMLSIWGTPTWAGPAKNRLPSRLADIQNFARALANRYSGRNRGYPFVRFYSVWNEPNLNLFLTPQFDAKGRSVAPANYAKLYRAAYTGFKQGSPQRAGRDRRHLGARTRPEEGGRLGHALAGQVRRAAREGAAEGALRRLRAPPVLVTGEPAADADRALAERLDDDAAEVR